MHFHTRLIPTALASCMVLLAFSTECLAQKPAGNPVVEQFPDSPQPQIAMADLPRATSAIEEDQAAQQTAPVSTPAQSSSSAPRPVAQTDAEKSAHEKAEEQLKQQEKQRVMGVMATFNTTTNRDALPLSSGQKYRLFIKSATDPWPFLLAGVVGGIGQAENSNPEWGQGMQGYAKRLGAGYSDYFIGNFFGNAVLPAWWHEDPRYFQKGTGSPTKRILWAAASTVWCRRDNGSWGPNYANVVGNFVGVSIARAYYPTSDRTVTGTIQDGITVSAEGIVGAEVIEFWPDLVRHHKRKKAEKLARLQALKDAQDTAQHAGQSAPGSSQHEEQKK